MSISDILRRLLGEIEPYGDTDIYFIYSTRSGANSFRDNNNFVFD